MTKMVPRDDPMMDAWVAEQPPQIQALCKKFPPGSTLEINGEQVYVVGYAEYGSPQGDPLGMGLVVSIISPDEDYAAARECSIHICPDCLGLIGMKGHQHTIH